MGSFLSFWGVTIYIYIPSKGLLFHQTKFNHPCLKPFTTKLCRLAFLIPNYAMLQPAHLVPYTFFFAQEICMTVKSMWPAKQNLWIEQLNSRWNKLYRIEATFENCQITGIWTCPIDKQRKRMLSEWTVAPLLLSHLKIYSNHIGTCHSCILLRYHLLDGSMAMEFETCYNFLEDSSWVDFDPKKVAFSGCAYMGTNHFHKSKHVMCL